MESNVAIQRVDENCAVVMYIAAKIGTLKNIPAGPQIIPQKTRFINIAKVEIFNVFPVNFGSIIFPNIVSILIKAIVVKTGICHVSCIINAYAIGRAHARIEPIVGI